MSRSAEFFLSLATVLDQFFNLADRSVVFRFGLDGSGENLAQKLFVSCRRGHFFHAPLSYWACVKTVMMKMRCFLYSIRTISR